jgi:glycosyltransferase involved in cell wall biosynthesis
LPLQSDFFFSFFVYTLKVIPERYAVVFVLKPYSNACIPALLKKFQHRDTKILLDVDDLDYAYRKGLVSYMIKFLQKPFPGFFDAMTVHNNNLRAILNKEFGIPEEKIFELRQGVDLDLFNEKNVDKNLKRKLRLENKHVIIYAAHLNIATDLEPILHAFEFVSAEIRDCKLVVVGGGPRQRYYEKKVEGMGLQRNVIFTGYLDKELFPSYIALGDVCVVYYENKLANFYRTSMKLREYLAMKMPVVCNDIGDLRQFHKYTYQSILFKKYGKMHFQII